MEKSAFVLPQTTCVKPLENSLTASVFTFVVVEGFFFFAFEEFSNCFSLQNNGVFFLVSVSSQRPQHLFFFP